MVEALFCVKNCSRASSFIFDLAEPKSLSPSAFEKALSSCCACDMLYTYSRVAMFHFPVKSFLKNNE